MTEELKQKAIESVKNIIKDNPIDEDYQTKDIYFRDLIDAYIAGATENGIQWHKNKKVPLCKGTIRIILYDNWREPAIISANSELEFIGGQENHIIAWCEISPFKG